MSIYSTDRYEIISIMKHYKKQNNNSIFLTGVLFIQGLPRQDYPFVVPNGMDKEDLHAHIPEEDFDNLNRFIANVIPVYETHYYEKSLNVGADYELYHANSAISPISMATSSGEGAIKPTCVA